MKVYELRMQYRKVFEASVIASLLIITLLIRYLSWTTSPPELPKVDIKMEVTKVDLTQQIKRPPPPSRPSIPIASETENLLGDETIDDTEIDLDEIPPPPPPPPKKEEKSEEAEIFVAYDTAPELKGGYEFIRKNLKYPDLARQAGLEGKVLIKAVIDEQGNVMRAEVLKEEPSNAGFGQAAIDVVMKCKFTPAKQRDKAVKVAITLPITFKLK